MQFTAEHCAERLPIREAASESFVAASQRQLFVDQPFDEKIHLPNGKRAEMPKELGVSSSSPTLFVEVFQQVINGLPEQIALLDSNWNIIAVNEAWTKTASLYSYDELRPGTNYHAFCRTKATEGHSSAVVAAAGIDEMIAGTRESYRYIYHGNDRWEGRTFQLAVSRLRIGDHAFVTVTRSDVTELADLRRRRESFSQLLIKGQGEERRRVGREVHDATMQSLVALQLSLGQIKRSKVPDVTAGIVAEMETILVGAHREVRAISFLLHPPQLEALGLRGALEGLVEGFQRRTGLTIALNFEGDTNLSWQAAEVAVYRMVQEALSNVHRHARATSAAVGLIWRRGMIHAAIVDDGVGLPPQACYGVGLSGMRERFGELGGRLTVKSASPGTILLASLPSAPRIRAVGDLAVHF